MMLFSVYITLFAIILGSLLKKSRISLFLLLFLLFLLFAFEKSDGDYLRYLTYFDEIGYGGNGYATTYEPLYVLTTTIAGGLGLEFDQMRWIFSAIEIILLYKVTTEFTINSAFVFSLFFIFPATLDAELFRFIFGMCVVIYGLQIILKNNSRKGYLKYAVCVIIAGLYHSSCWIAFIYLLLFFKSRYKLFFLVSIVLLSSFFFVKTGVLFRIFEFLPIRSSVIGRYETGEYANINGLLYGGAKKILIFTLPLLAIGSIKFLKLSNSTLSLNEQRQLPKEKCNSCIILHKRIVDINIISFLTMIPLFFAPASQRLDHIVLFYNYIEIANICLVRHKILCTIYPILVGLILLMVQLFFESEGTLIAFLSHFTEGYLINFSEVVLGLK